MEEFYEDMLQELIFEGENSRIEFKRKFTTPTKIAKEISAFANTRGGYLIFGIDDDGSVYGVPSEKSEMDLIETASGFYLEPPLNLDIYIVNYKYKDVVVVQVPESDIKPVRVLDEPDNKKTSSKAYIRVGEQSVIASSEMGRVLKGRNSDSPPIKMIVGEKEKGLLTFIGKHGRATVADFQKLCNISKRRAERLMVRLVRAGVLQIHHDSGPDYFTIVGE
jgi:predicted HTH transcriptional regulator